PKRPLLRFGERHADLPHMVDRPRLRHPVMVDRNRARTARRTRARPQWTLMHFDRFSVALLILRPDAPRLDQAAEAALQDAHLAHLAHLHASGVLLAAGPLSDEHYRGLSILNVGVEEARALKE